MKEKALKIHENGKLSVISRIPMKDGKDLALAYTPGVAFPCLEIKEDTSLVYQYTSKGHMVAIVTDGTAVLGLGDIGPHASLPVMEGKALLLKRFADIDAFPIALDTKDPDKIIEVVKLISPIFGGIILEDISSPRCVYIEQKLKKELNIPVFHDDQHGTAIVVLAAIMNYCRLTSRNMEDLSIVINGAGAAGIAISRYLGRKDPHTPNQKIAKEIIVCDSTGILAPSRSDLNEFKIELLSYTNPRAIEGTVHDAIKGADVFIGVSKAGLLYREDIQTMAKDPLILALANPVPEILPEEAYAGGALVVGTGRSDFPNQVNNVLAFPGIFLGAMRARAPRINLAMKFAAAEAIASGIQNVTRDQLIPPVMDESIAQRVADAVSNIWINRAH